MPYPRFRRLEQDAVVVPPVFGNLPGRDRFGRDDIHTPGHSAQVRQKPFASAVTVNQHPPQAFRPLAVQSAHPALGRGRRSAQKQRLEVVRPFFHRHHRRQRIGAEQAPMQGFGRHGRPAPVPVSAGGIVKQMRSEFPSHDGSLQRHPGFKRERGFRFAHQVESAATAPGRKGHPTDILRIDRGLARYHEKPEVTPGGGNHLRDRVQFEQPPVRVAGVRAAILDVVFDVGASEKPAPATHVDIPAFGSSPQAIIDPVLDLPEAAAEHSLLVDVAVQRPVVVGFEQRAVVGAGEIQDRAESGLAGWGLPKDPGR